MAAPGIKDVAARAGVSVGTVSNVLNRPDVVTERTRDKVLEAITALGFVRNESARQLRNGHSRTLAYLVLDPANPFFTDVARGAEDAARAAGLALYLCNSGCVGSSSRRSPAGPRGCAACRTWAFPLSSSTGRQATRPPGAAWRWTTSRAGTWR
jgi:hypothetical protein